MPSEENVQGPGLLERWKDMNLQYLKLDELDLRILDELKGDSKKHNNEIARALKVSETTVRRRIGHMEDMGLIAGYSLHIDFGVLENAVKAYVTVKADTENRLKIARKMCQHPRSLAVYKTAGDDGILCVMLFTSPSEFQDFADKHPIFEGVRSVTIQAVMSAYKGTVWSGA